MPTITREDIQSVFNCLIDDDLTPNHYMEKFSALLKKETGIKNLVLISNYIQSFDLIFSFMDIEPDDEFILPASANKHFLYFLNKNRLKPVLADVMENSLIPSPDTIEKLINKKTRGVIIPQLFGIPHDLKIYGSFGVPLIEDCDGSFVSSINGKKIGSFGDYTIIALNDNSVITTGSGSILGSNENSFGKLIKGLKDNWSSRDLFMSNLNAALGIAQIKNLSKNIENRKKLTSYYDRAVMESGSYLIDRYDNQELVPTKYIAATNTPFEDVKGFFSKYGVKVERAIPDPLHRVMEMSIQKFKNTEALSRKLIILPFYPKLKKEEIETVIKCIKAIL